MVVCVGVANAVVRYKVNMAECPLKASLFQEQHCRRGPVGGRGHAGAKELASGYTQGKTRQPLLAPYSLYPVNREEKNGGC